MNIKTWSVPYYSTPIDAQREFGTPPLQDQRGLNGWVENVLEGYPAEDVNKWVDDFVLGYPAEQQQSIKDQLLLSVQDNRINGQRRQNEVHQDLTQQYPGASVQDEQYLRDGDGNISIDPKTGTARRLDHVVIENGRVIDVVETTSMGANKRTQLLHEANVRNNGGTFVRDRNTGQLVQLNQTSRIERRP